MNTIIRPVQLEDADQILEIYRPVIVTTAISFETEPPTLHEIKQRIGRVSARWPWFVLQQDDLILGYAYAVPFRARPAYQHTAETTVYVRQQDRGAGVGRRLMEHLLSQLCAAGHHLAVAGISLPNPASVALHERLGFEPVGVFREVGRKFEKWHDVGFWSRVLEKEV